MTRYKSFLKAWGHRAETGVVTAHEAGGPAASTGQAPAKQPRRVKPARLLRVAVAVTLIGIIYFQIGWQPVLQSLTNVVWLWLVAMLLTVPVDRFLATLRWQILLRVLGVGVATSALFKRVWTAGIFNSILPGQFGGDFFRVFHPWDISVKKSVIGSSVLVDRVTGVIGLLIFVSLLGFYKWDLVRELGLAAVPAASALVAALMLGTIMLAKPMVWLRRTTVWWPTRRPRVLAEEIIDSLLVYAEARWSILAAVTVSLVFRLVKALGVYFAFLAIGVNVPLEGVIFVSLVIQAITLVPITINGWGIREGAYVLLFTQIGVSSSEALAAALLPRVLGLFTSSLVGLLYVARRWELHSGQIPGNDGSFVRESGGRLASGLRRVYRGLFRHDQWSIGVIDAPIHTFLQPGARPTPNFLVQKDNSRIMADPFGVQQGDRLTILCEEFDYKSPKGIISWVEFNGDGWSDVPTVAMDHPSHMSYPYLIEHQGEIYCIPETYQSREVALYRAEDFPHRWTRVATLLEDLPVLDPAVFQYQGVWWLTCTLRGAGQHRDLLVWYAPDLLGPWRPHANNPVKSDIRSARPGGTPFIYQGCLYRPAQDCSQTYGGRITINRVLRLTPAEFEEEPAAIVEPFTDGPFPDGIHTLSAVGDMTLIDSKRFVFIGSALRLELNRRLILSWLRVRQGLGQLGLRPDVSGLGDQVRRG